MTIINTQPFMVGRYLITPLSHTNESGRHTAALSIRSGQGTSTHNRIFSFTREFGTKEKALIHASHQGHAWLKNPQAFACTI